MCICFKPPDTTLFYVVSYDCFELMLFIYFILRFAYFLLDFSFRLKESHSVYRALCEGLMYKHALLRAFTMVFHSAIVLFRLVSRFNMLWYPGSLIGPVALCESNYMYFCALLFAYRRLGA